MTIYNPHLKFKYIHAFNLFLISLFCLNSFLPTSLFAWEAEASLSQNEVEVGETFQIIVSVRDSEKKKDLPWPDLQGDLSNFKLDKSTGASTQNRTMIINGKVTQENLTITQFVFSLTPKTAGQFRIGPILYKYNGEERNLGSGQIRAVKSEDGLDMRQQLEPRTAYIGQQVFYNLRFVEKNPIQNIALPSLQQEMGQNFYFQHLTEQAKAKQIQENGQQLRAWDIPIALFPIIPGKLTIPEINVKYQQVVRTRARSGSMFDMFESQFFGGRAVERNATTRPQNIEVLPLPSGAPSNFSGAVGSYTLNTQITATEVKAGDAVNLTITIQGDGQPKGISDPKMPTLTGWEVFDPEIQQSTDISGNQLISKKVFQYALIPTREGNATIEGIQFSYFDPKSRSYKTLKSPTYTVKVLPGKLYAGSAPRSMTQQEILQLGSDIRHIKKPNGKLENYSSNLYTSWIYYLMYLLGPILFIITLFYQKRQQTLQSDSALRRRLESKSKLKSRLNESAKYMAAGQANLFYKALQAGLERFVSDQLNWEMRGQTSDEIKRVLSEKGIQSETLAGLMKLMDTCDMGQFAGGGSDTSSMQSAYQNATQTLERISKEIRA